MQSMIHGKKDDGLVHVAGIKDIIGRTKIYRFATELQRYQSRRGHILAWEYEPNIREFADNLEKHFSISLHLHIIPEEIMQKNQDPRKIAGAFEIPRVYAEPFQHDDGTWDVRLSDYTASFEHAIMKKKPTGPQGIKIVDLWAVDFEWTGYPFKHHWQDYRTRQHRNLELESWEHWHYPPGNHTLAILTINSVGVRNIITRKISV